jgi:hypothetical protein
MEELRSGLFVTYRVMTTHYSATLVRIGLLNYTKFFTVVETYLKCEVKIRACGFWWISFLKYEKQFTE